MKRIIKYLILGVIALVFVGTLVFLYRKSQQPPVVYQLDSPARMTIVKKTVATGKVIPRREIEVKAQVSGVVDKLYVVAGQTVKKGAIIARISLRPNMLNVSAAEAQLLRRGSTCRTRPRTCERYRSCWPTGSSPNRSSGSTRPTTTCRKRRWRRRRTPWLLLKTGHRARAWSPT